MLFPIYINSDMMVVRILYRVKALVSHCFRPTKGYVMERELLRMCGYKEDQRSLDLVREVKSNYLNFEKVVSALKDLQPFLDHSDYYLSLRSGHHMIKIKNDLLNDEDIISLDAEILVWANEHGVEIQEEPGQISIMGCELNE